MTFFNSLNDGFFFIWFYIENIVTHFYAFTYNRQIRENRREIVLINSLKERMPSEVERSTEVSLRIFIECNSFLLAEYSENVDVLLKSKGTNKSSYIFIVFIFSSKNNEIEWGRILVNVSFVCSNHANEIHVSSPSSIVEKVS